MDTHYATLQQDALLHIEGPDSLTFLQGQTTCDTREVNAAQAGLGVYCTPQGRVVCDFLLAQLGEDHFGLRMRRDLRATAAATFGKYIVFSKAELDCERDDWQALAIWGESAADDLRALFGEVPAGTLACVSGDQHILIQTDEQGQQFECYLAGDSAYLEKLRTEFTQADEAEWQRLQIEAGLPRIEAASSESEVPQVLNYDLTGHISFDKGCYTGQEVVARLHYRGRSKRRSYLAHLPRAAGAGEPVFTAAKEQSVGNVINSVGEKDAVALVTLAESALQETLHLGAQDGPELTLGELPYALPAD